MGAVDRMADREVPDGARRRRASGWTRPPYEPEPDPSPVGEEKPSEDERRLVDLLASKRERLTALETEREEYKRVRAHLGDLMAHNSASVDKVLQEIDELESLQRHAGRIRAALVLG